MFSRKRAAIVAVALAALLGMGATARPQVQPQQVPFPEPTTPAQMPGQFPGQPPTIEGGRPSDQQSPLTRRMQAKQAERRNEARQEQLVRDTARLFDLAQELKDQVGKTNPNILSVDVVKKADEIEKLAKSVREKMKAD